MDTLRKSLVEVSAASGLSQFGATVAAAGLIGKFDQGLTRAAVAATALIESTENEPDALDDARAQSALIDSVADVEAFTRKLPTATQDEVRQLTETLLEALFSKYGERRQAAQSPQARWSLDRILTFITILLAIWGIRYNDQSLHVSEESLQLAKSAAEGSTQDMAALRAEISKSDKEQVEELRKVREVLERCAESEQEADTDDATYYIVERSTTLTISPSTKAPRVSVIYPNQSVTLIQRKHKWLKVQYYDYLSSKIIEGWVLKKIFTPIAGLMGEANESVVKGDQMTFFEERRSRRRSRCATHSAKLLRSSPAWSNRGIRSFFGSAFAAVKATGSPLPASEGEPSWRESARGDGLVRRPVQARAVK